MSDGTNKALPKNTQDDPCDDWKGEGLIRKVLSRRAKYKTCEHEDCRNRVLLTDNKQFCVRHRWG